MSSNSTAFRVLAAFSLQLSLMLCSAIGLAQYPVIELAALSSTAIEAGTSQTIQIAGGNHLDRIDQLLVSDPRITANVLRRPRPDTPPEAAAADLTPATPIEDEILWGQFNVHVPADVPPGRYEVWAVGAYGVSNPRILVVSSSPVVHLPQVSQQPQEPTSIDESLDLQRGLVVVHRATSARVDHFQLTAQPDRSLRITVDAQRIDSRMIAQIRLLDHEGELVKHVRGADGFDPTVEIPAGQGKRYTLAISDFLFRGGLNYGYQLRIEPRPAASSELSDSEQLVIGSFHNTNSTVLGPVDRLELTAVHRELWSAPLDSSQYQPPLSKATEATISNPGQLVRPFPQPIVARVRLGQQSNTHLIRFSADAGQTLAVEVVAQRVGVPADPRISVQQQEAREDGVQVWKTIATNDDQPQIGDGPLRIRSRDPVIVFTAPAAGMYRAMISSLDAGKELVDGPAYRLVVRAPVPSFNLLAARVHPHNDPAQTRPAGYQLKRGDAVAFRVLAFRQDGFAGPIAVTVEGLPAGVSCRPAVISASQTEATLVVQADQTTVAWLGSLQIVGRDASTENPLPTTVTALQSTCLWGTGDQRDFIRSRLTLSLPFAVSDQSTVPLSLSLQPSSQPPAPAEGETIDEATLQAAALQAAALVSQPFSLSAAAGAELTVPVQLFRRPGATGPVVLRPRNLPPAVTAPEVTIAADQSTGAIQLTIAAGTPPGQYSCWFLGESRVRFQPVTQTAEQELVVFVPTSTVDITVTAP